MPVKKTPTPDAQPAKPAKSAKPAAAAKKSTVTGKKPARSAAKESIGPTKEAVKELKEKLFKDYPNLWDTSSQDDRETAFEFAEEYRRFLDLGKTEREVVIASIETVEALGFVDIEKAGPVLKPGSKVYRSIRGKGLVVAVVGKKPAVQGMNILGAHIDSPRIDLKPVPLYEDSDLVYFKTHYYGGIKKYQWVSMPLALHGIVVRGDGTKVTICVGEKDEDPVFTITDLLPHLGMEQMARKANETVKGEELNLLIGSLPYGDKEQSGRFKLGVMKHLHDTYGITEKDLVSAELEIVPAFRARDLGFDRSFVGAYGQDDRVCSFPALVAVTDQERPDKTCVCLLSDKEEIGSDGNTGAKSRLYINFLADLFARTSGGYDELGFQKCLENSRMLSADVSVGYDPTFASVSDPKNSAYIGRGIVLEKYTGHRGKNDASDANAEFYSSVIRALDANGIPWQTGELGKVDAGGGGTIAKYMANLGIEVLDCGVPVLSMHGPFEVTSKIDIYYTYLAYKRFIEAG